jgi:transposase
MVLFMTPTRSFSELEWHLTPETVRQYILALERALFDTQKQLQSHEVRIEKLEVQTRKDSTNSSKPPSSDSPFKRPERKGPKSKRAKGGQKGHKAHQQQMLAPTWVENLLPERCTCGCQDFTGQHLHPFHTHQHIELPPIHLDIARYVLNQCKCPRCGKTVKAQLPQEAQTGYGPRLSAFVAELSGVKAMSRADVQSLCASVLGLPIATGTIQKIVNRASAALEAPYQKIADTVRSAEVNYIDETSHFKEHDLQWLWAMVNKQAAFYHIDDHRSKEAFLKLVASWNGILVSDGYGVYKNWVNDRQTCLAHLIRDADGLAQRNKPDIRRFGQIIGARLRELTDFATAPPDLCRWDNFYRHLLFSLKLYEDDETDAGKFARRVARQLDSFWTFLENDGVEPTNNRAERSLRFAVLWRKRSLGARSEKGNRWVERILSFKETCRLRAKATFPLLVELIRNHFTGTEPYLAWI